ncbi:esterase/lipase family protein [Nocardia sp. NPDC058058]|uniref:esterase/lipase family protein n=1 Tax=Nocardia sp. NPDC058058 TaxID=3346317 RepID=UPI0036DF65EB
MRIAAKFTTALISASMVAMVAVGPAAAAPDTGSGAAVVPAGTTIEPSIDCTPDSAHPRPVVVLPGADGTTSDTATQWNTMLTTVRAAGYCAFLFQGGVINGNRWSGDIPSAAQQVADFVTEVRQTTGADQVDLVAHSAGTIVANHFLKALGGAPVVARAVLLTPEARGCDGAGFLSALGIKNSPISPVQMLSALPFLGTVLAAIAPDKANLVQMLPSSPVYQAVFNGQITQPGVHYSVLSTRNDELATPASVCTNLTEPGVNMNFYEDLFPGAAPVGHSTLRSSPDTANWVAEQLQA